MKEELRKYRALAFALIVTLVVAVLLFVQFLRMDLVHAEDALAARVTHAAADGATRMTLLIEQLRLVGRAYLRSGVTDVPSLDIVRRSGLGAALEFVCTREADAVRVLYADPALAVGGAAAPDRCGADFTPSLTLAPTGAGDASPAPEARVTRSSLGGAPSLELRMHDGETRELRAVLSTAALVERLALGANEADVPVAAVCLALHVDGEFHTLACDGEDPPTAGSDAAGTTAESAQWRIEEMVTAGLRWRVIVMPDHRLLAGAVTSLPFVMFGAALALGAVACAFTYRAVDKNLMLEARSKELRARLEQLERLEDRNGTLDLFAAMAAHDLQAPLRFIVSNAHLLCEELGELERPDLSRTGATLIEQGERMRALVLGLLDFCRAEQSEPSIAPTDVAALVDVEIALLRAREEYAGTHISVGPLPRALPCDAGQLTQILRNLLGNAVKFSQRSSPPTVSIRADQDGRHGDWTFRIEDNGPGVGENHRERIFLPFNRLDHGTEGTGIGLAIVKRLIERHGGAIWLDPDVTEGSAFCFTMPGATPAETSR